MQLKRKRILAAIGAAVTLAVVVISGVRLGRSVDVLSKYGSRGSEVTEIQKRLKNWGYYNGSVDGIYGAKTRDAVRYFQRKNGLTVDGIAGPKTLAAMGISSSSGGTSTRQKDINLLARIISAEAKGEPYLGQVAVGAVVLNRVEHPSFPDTIAGVIYQPGAFTAVSNGEINKAVASSCYNAAREALSGSDPTGGAIYYYNPKKTNDRWIRTRPVVKVIGAHYFCR